MTPGNSTPPPGGSRAGFLMLFALALLSACQKQVINQEAMQGLSAVPYPTAPAQLAPTLCVLVWPDTIIPRVARDFENRYGVKLEIITFANNDDARARLMAKPTAYDVVMVTEYMASRMRQEGLLMPVPKFNPDLYRMIDTSVLNAKADPRMIYYVPFDYSALGISFNVDYVSGFPRKWEYLTEQGHNPYLYGRMVMTDDMRYALGAAMLYAGQDPQNATAEQLAAARDLLVRNIRSMGLRFLPDAKIRAEMLNQSALMAIVWSGEAAAILKQRANCRFLIPEGKSIVTTDGFCIPKQARHPESAALFIEYMLHPYVSAIVANETMYASVNTRSMKHVSRFVINGPSCNLAPPRDFVHMKTLEGEELMRYQQAWAEVKRVEVDAAKINLIPLP